MLRTAVRYGAPTLPQLQFRCGFRCPWVGRIIGCDDLIGVLNQKLTKRCNVQPVVHRREIRQIFFRKPEQTCRRRQAFAMLCMRRMLEALLQVNKSAGGLDQALEKICVTRLGVKPKLLKHIVRFVIAQFVPATEKCDIKRMLSHVSVEKCVACSRRALARCINAARGRAIFAPELTQPLRNPLAFIHGELYFASSSENEQTHRDQLFPRLPSAVALSRKRRAIHASSVIGHKE